MVPHPAGMIFESPLNRRWVSTPDGRLLPLPGCGSGPAKKVAIVGAGEPSGNPRYSDDSWEVWGLNSVRIFDRSGRFRADRWFQLHPPWSLSLDERLWAPLCPVPTYTIEAWPEMRQWVRYPLDTIVGSLRLPHAAFCSSMAYMMVLAIYEGFSEIALLGIQLQAGHLRERLAEYPNLAYWVGVAEGRGITVTIPPSSGLLQFPYRYGYDYEAERRWGRLLAQEWALAARYGVLDDGDLDPTARPPSADTPPLTPIEEQHAEGYRRTPVQPGEFD